MGDFGFSESFADEPFMGDSSHHYMEAPPPPYEKPVFPLLKSETVKYILHTIRWDPKFNSIDIFDADVEAEEKRLRATGMPAKCATTAHRNVSKTWGENGFLQLPDMKEFDNTIAKVLKQLVDKPLMSIWARDDDSFEAWLISRPWCQYNIACGIMELEHNSLGWPSAYKHSSYSAVLKAEWSEVHEDGGRNSWFWKGEDQKKVIQGLLQPRARRSRRVVERQYEAKLRAEAEADWQEIQTMRREKKAEEEGDKRTTEQTQVEEPKTKSAAKAKKPYPSAANKKKPVKPKATKQETPKRGKTIAKAVPKKRKATAKEPAPKKRKAAEPAKARKPKGADQAAPKRRKVTK